MKEMIKGHIQKLLFMILLVLLLLGVCISIDYADEITISNVNESIDGLNLTDNTKVVNVNESASNIVAKSSDKIYTKYSTITMTGKPSCQCGRYSSYTWRTRTYINYCPNCGNYGCLGNKHKYAARFENEISCYICDSDYCINCGHEKYSWSRVYLTRA